jgi:hypothetical protein
MVTQAADSRRFLLLQPRLSRENARPSPKSFLLLFFKKEGLAFFKRKSRTGTA